MANVSNAGRQMFIQVRKEREDLGYCSIDVFRLWSFHKDGSGISKQQRLSADCHTPRKADVIQKIQRIFRNTTAKFEGMYAVYYSPKKYPDTALLRIHELEGARTEKAEAFALVVEAFFGSGVVREGRDFLIDIRDKESHLPDRGRMELFRSRLENCVSLENDLMDPRIRQILYEKDPAEAVEAERAD